jgi:hypothetical protein
MKYAIVQSDGKPLYTSWLANPEDLPDLPQDHEAILLDNDSDNLAILSSYWNGTNWVQRPANTPSYFKYDKVSETWVDSRNLDDVKVAKLTELNKAYRTAMSGNFYFNTTPVQMGGYSKSNIDAVNGYISLNNSLPTNWSGTWKAADNSLIQIPDVSTWTEFYAAMIDQISNNFEKLQTLKTRVTNSNTIDKVDSISW